VYEWFLVSYSKQAKVIPMLTVRADEMAVLVGCVHSQCAQFSQHSECTFCDDCCAAVNGVCTCQDFSELNSKAEYSSIPKHSIRAIQSRVFETICLFHPKQSIRGLRTLRSINPKQSIREKACALDSSALETMVRNQLDAGEAVVLHLVDHC